MSPFNCYTCQLSQIRGVSIESANQIAQLYPSMLQLIMAFQHSNNEMLSDIVVGKNAHRRLGSVLSKRIHEYLCSPQLTLPQTQLTLPQPKIKLIIRQK